MEKDLKKYVIRPPDLYKICAVSKEKRRKLEKEAKENEQRIKNKNPENRASREKIREATKALEKALKDNRADNSKIKNDAPKFNLYETYNPDKQTFDRVIASGEIDHKIFKDACIYKFNFHPHEIKYRYTKIVSKEKFDKQGNVESHYTETVNYDKYIQGSKPHTVGYR